MVAKPPAKAAAAPKLEPTLPPVAQPAKTTATLPKVEPALPPPPVPTPSSSQLPISAAPSVAESPALPSAIGADISPVTTEPPIPSVAVPPLSEQKLVKAPQPIPPVAQLPPEATTPLPPASVLPPTGLEIESGNGVPISVPPPVSVPSAQPEIVIEAPQVSSVTQPKQSQGPTIVPTFDIPSTVRSVPVDTTPQVAVPTLGLPPQTVNTVGLPKSIPTPAPIAVPPLNPVPVTVAPVIKPPVSSVIQVPGSPPLNERIFESPTPGSVSTVSPQTPKPIQVAPPNSWVMQSSGGVPPGTSVSGIVSVPPPVASIPSVSAPKAPTPTSAKVTPPPNSWVMQASNLAAPTLTQPLQPPASSVIQSPPMQPSSVQSVGLGSIAAPGPTTQPSVIAPTSFPTATPTVSVPPLQASPNSGVMPTVSVSPLSTAPGVGVAPTVSVPPLQSSGTSFPASPAPAANSGVVEFGKPLPMNGATSLNTLPQGIPTSPSFGVQPIGAVQSANPAIAVSIGTVLNLSYPGATELQLGSGPRQDMMVLQTEVRDAAGNVVFPQGSYVMGQFETSSAGSKFVTSSIQRGDRIIPFFAESDPLAGGTRDISAASMAIYSGAGVLAGGLVSKFSTWGLLLGGAAGAATNYLTAPKSATIQPGQVIQVRMLRDIPY